MQTSYLRLTPVAGGSTIEVIGPEFERDSQGNLSVRLAEPLNSSRTARLLVEDLTAVLSTNVDVQRNRNMAVLAVTDPGGVLLEAEWTEFDPWLGSRRGPFTMRCVAVLSGARMAADEDRISLILYRTQFRFERGSGALEGE